MQGQPPGKLVRSGCLDDRPCNAELIDLGRLVKKSCDRFIEYGWICAVADQFLKSVSLLKPRFQNLQLMAGCIVGLSCQPMSLWQ